jgi:predicted neuraminidase
MMRIASLCILALAGVAGYIQIDSRLPWAPFSMPVAIESELLVPEVATPVAGKKPQLNTQVSIPEPRAQFIPETAAPSVHAGSAILLNDGNLRAFWFAGSREGATDVVIQTAVLDTKAGNWSNPEVVIDRVAAEKGLSRYIKKLGNPLPVRSSQGKLQLYFVTVSVGGWAGSSISWMESSDEGVSWSRPQRLITSPALNLSTLIKAPGFDFTDGTLGLPVYHEWMGKFGELIRVDGGRVIDKRRMSSGRALLQPIVFIDAPEKAVAYFRQARSEGPSRIASAQTENAGQSWTSGVDLDLANPNAAIAGLQLLNGDRLIALNDLESGRYRLVLAIAPAGTSNWNVIAEVESDQTLINGLHREFSYPSLLLGANGEVHLIYTYDRKKMKHVQFDPRWIESKKNRKGDS